MNITSRILLIFFVLSVSLSINAQTGEGGNGYVPDWAIGQHGENKKENNNSNSSNNSNKPFVSDWAIGQNGDPYKVPEANKSEHISDWHIFSKTEEVPVTPQGVIDADNMYFDDVLRNEMNTPVKPTPLVASENGRRDNLLFGLALGYDTRTFYEMDKRDANGRIIESIKMDKATDIMASKTLYEYTQEGDVIQSVEEYYPQGSLHRKYQYKNGKLEGDYYAYSKEGVMIISRNYANGLLNGFYLMYYSVNGNIHKQILYKNDLKINSVEYALDGVTIIKETTYNDKGGVLTTKEPVLDEKGNKLTQYYDYGYKPFSKVVNGDANVLYQTPMVLDGKKFMMEDYVIKQIEAMAGVTAPEGYKGDTLLWYIEKALAFIAEEIGTDMKLTDEHIDLIFGDNMIFALTHLARKYELAGDRVKALEIRYDVMLIGTFLCYNLKHHNNISRDYYNILKGVYNQLNISQTVYSSKDMKRYLEEQNIIMENNDLMLNRIEKYNGIVRTEAAKFIKIK